MRRGNTDRKFYVLPVKYNKRRNRIEIIIGRLKDWHRVATRYDHCPTSFFSLPLAATMPFWL
jgi:transposase